MRTAIRLALLLTIAAPVAGQESKSSPDKAISEALRDVHDRGADLFNAGEVAAGYRMYHGGLIVTRAALGHRPDVQKSIADGIAAAERQSSLSKRAFMLHELIEQVRLDLRSPAKKGTEILTVPPREVKPGLKPTAGVGEISTGVLGRVVWQGAPVAGVDVTYVSVGKPNPRVYEATTGAQGVYVIAELEAGKYIVLITPGPNATVKKLPERYATTTTSPLVLEVKGKGDKNDFFLQ